MDKDNIIVINFAEATLPVFKETRSKEWIMMGEDDDYPNYLIELYNSSPKHRAIVSGKAGYVFGKGLKAVTEGPNEQAFLSSVNRYKQNANDLVKKSILDIELHSGFYWQIIPSPTGKEFFKLDFRKVRKDKNGRGYWFKKDGKWGDRKEKAVLYPSYLPSLSVASIFAYYEYRPGMDDYPLPDYVSATNYIESDIEVSKHVWNNAKGGFTASKMINFFNGEPEEEKKKQIVKRLKAQFTGSLAEKLVISFNNPNATKPEVLDLGTSDLTKEDFSRVDNLIQQNIFTAHRVTSPMLFGIKTEGQLGGRTEIVEAYEIFKNTYVNEKQQNIEEVINFFGKQMGLSEIRIEPTDPISPAEGEAGEAMGVNENLKNLTGKQNQAIERIKRNYKKGQITREEAVIKLKEGYGLSDEAINAMLGQQFSASDDEELIQCFSEVGTPRNEFVVLKSKKVYFSSDKDCLEDELQQYQLNFKEEVTDKEAQILLIIKRDKRATPEVIGRALKMPVDEVKQTLTSLTDRGLITTKVIKEHDTEVEIRENVEPPSKVLDKDQRVEILIRYSYEGPQDNRNRAFCAKLLALDRFYTRREIESISERLGYSVWDRCGGFWRQPDGTISPKCRHHWKSNVVLKKESK